MFSYCVFAFSSRKFTWRKNIMKTNYRNVFAEIGIPEEKINKRLEEIKEQFFHGEDRTTVSHGQRLQR